MQGFIFGKGTDVPSPDALAKRRALLNAMQARNASVMPKNLWEGLNSATDSITGALQSRQLDSTEAEAKAGADAAYAPVIEAIKNKGKVGNDALVGAMGNEWLSDPQQGVVSALLRQNLESDAPLTAWQNAQLAKDDQITPYQREYLDYLKSKAADGGGGEYGLNPVWAQDANGNWQLFQPNKGGGAPARVAFPDGVNPQPQVNYHDTGTGFVGLTAKGGQPAGQVIAKDLAGAEEQKAIGKGTGEAAVALPQIESSAKLMLDTIDNLTGDPYLPSMVGPVNARLPNITGDAARVQSKMDQLQGQTFLQAYDTLRGGGQITEVEGAKAERAKARMAAAQNYADYKQAADELRGVIDTALKTARTKAGGQANAGSGSQNAFSTDPQFGQEVNGFKIGQTAKNPQTGETIVWDGNGWRPQ